MRYATRVGNVWTSFATVTALARHVFGLSYKCERTRQPKSERGLLVFFRVLDNSRIVGLHRLQHVFSRLAAEREIDN
jgi:hypothetical protein